MGCIKCISTLLDLGVRNGLGNLFLKGYYKTITGLGRGFIHYLTPCLSKWNLQ